MRLVMTGKTWMSLLSCARRGAALGIVCLAFVFVPTRNAAACDDWLMREHIWGHVTKNKPAHPRKVHRTVSRPRLAAKVHSFTHRKAVRKLHISSKMAVRHASRARPSKPAEAKSTSALKKKVVKDARKSAARAEREKDRPAAPSTENTTALPASRTSELTAAQITAAQQHLKYMGYNIPSDSGALDPETKSAMGQFQESIGAPKTGTLTVEQLKTLFEKAAERQKQAQ